MKLMTQETLKAVNDEVLTDEQLVEALTHYRQLVKLLNVHGEKYFLVWRDTYMKLMTLEGFKKARQDKGRKIDIEDF